MRGPLHASIYDTTRISSSYWEATAGSYAERAPLEGDVDADFAVIGGGFAGLSAALELAGAGARVAVLEAGAIGWGSSGRARGIVGFGGHKLSDAALARRFGAEAVAQYYGAQLDNLRRLRGFAREALGLWCQEGGELYLAHSRSAARALAAEEPVEGNRIDAVPPSGQADIAAHGGTLMHDAFGVHPLRLVRALADRAEAAGARLFPRSEVVGWQRVQQRHELVTAGGRVNAGAVLVATNAFAPEGLHSVTTARVVPVLSNIAVTRPLGAAELARHPWFGPGMTGADTRHMLAYFRLLPEEEGGQRLLFGMRGDTWGRPAGLERMRHALRRRLDRAFPGWAGVEITHYWRGPVCMTRAFTPSVGLAEEGVAHAFGWHGSGINMGTLAGRLIGRLLAGESAEIIPAPMRGLAPALPLPGLRPLYVAAMRRVYALSDRLS